MDPTWQSSLFLFLIVLINNSNSLRTFHHFLWIIEERLRDECIIQNSRELSYCIFAKISIIAERPATAGYLIFEYCLHTIMNHQTGKEKTVLKFCLYTLRFMLFIPNLITFL